MAARFKRGVRHVTLANEDAEDLQESDTAVLISEDEMTKEHTMNAEMDAEERGMPDLIPITNSSTKWKFWKKRRYILTHSSDQTTSSSSSSGIGKEITLCGRRVRLCGINSWRAIFVVLFVFTLAIAISIIITKLAKQPPAEHPTSTNSNTSTNPQQGAVALDSTLCADMSAGILLRGGSAVDAAITGMLCVGVVHAESSGIGGGGFMTVRLANGSVYALNFRETAPMGATEDMFHANATAAEIGGLSIAVPGEVKGMEVAHKLFGRLPWKELFQPVIEICKHGFNVTEHAAVAVSSSWDDMSANLQAVYTTASGEMLKAGDNLTRPDLAETLEAIALGGADAFYSGPIAQSIVDTVSEEGGIITLQDLQNYTVKMEKPLETQFDGKTFYSPPVPSGGPDFLFMLSLMELYHHNASSDPDLVYQRLVEAFKFAYAERTRLADPFCDSQECRNVSESILQAQRNMFNATYISKIWANISDNITHNTSYYHPHFSSPINDSGTTHLSILSPGGDAVAVTSTINTYFGSKVMTDTGIVLNDEMDDFSSPNITNSFGVPPSSINFIRPGKRPLSSTCPTIAVQTDGTDGTSKVSVVIGGSGGSRIPTAVAQAVLRTLTFEESISAAIEARRVHHQLVPTYLQYESGFPNKTLTFLQARGHKLRRRDSSFAVVQGIRLDKDGCATGHGDSRKHGKAVVVSEAPTPQCN